MEAMRPLKFSSGRAVVMLMVAPMPPAGCEARLVFQTSSPEID